MKISTLDRNTFMLRVAKPSATDEELLNALKLANFTDHNCTLQGTALLDMTLGNKGMSVSGGQRQRISLARLFLRNPSLIIIDESTASLDLVNEKIVLENIIHMYPKATKISISHRPTTFAYSDLIYVFNEGKISDYGTPGLIGKKRIYPRDYKTFKSSAAYFGLKLYFTVYFTKGLFIFSCPIVV